MCVETAVRADIRVSIQDRSAPDRASGHLAAGVLVDADVVLVPNPPKRLFAPDLDAEVLVFPVDLEPRLAVEAPPIWKWGRFAVGDEGPLAVTAKLGRPSIYSAQIGRADAAALAAEVGRTGGDLWEALRRQRIIPEGIDQLGPELLARAGELELAQREPRRADHRFDSLEQLTTGFCVLFCFCEPHGPR